MSTTQVPLPRSRRRSLSRCGIGGPRGARTPDLLIANQLLACLSATSCNVLGRVNPQQTLVFSGRNVARSVAGRFPRFRAASLPLAYPAGNQCVRVLDLSRGERGVSRLCAGREAQRAEHHDAARDRRCAHGLPRRAAARLLPARDATGHAELRDRLYDARGPAAPVHAWSGGTARPLGCAGVGEEAPRSGRARWRSARRSNDRSPAAAYGRDGRHPRRGLPVVEGSDGVAPKDPPGVRAHPPSRGHSGPGPP